MRARTGNAGLDSFSAFSPGLDEPLPDIPAARIALLVRSASDCLNLLTSDRTDDAVSRALSEFIFNVLQVGHKANNCYFGCQLLHRNHENGLNRRGNAIKAQRLIEPHRWVAAALGQFRRREIRIPWGRAMKGRRARFGGGTFRSGPAIPVETRPGKTACCSSRRP